MRGSEKWVIGLIFKFVGVILNMTYLYLASVISFNIFIITF